MRKMLKATGDEGLFGAVIIAFSVIVPALIFVAIFNESEAKGFIEWWNSLPTVIEVFFL